MSGKKCHCEEGLPEWLMSYADMITILMAFFVVMYSMAGSRDEAKEQAVLESLREQFGPSWPHLASLGPGPYVRRDSPLAKIATSGNGARGESKADKPRSKARGSLGNHPRVHTLRPGEQTAVGGIVYFPESSSALGEEQKKQLKLAADELRGKLLKIEVRGHTSRRPISKTAGFRDHWELAYQRCRSVMEYLVEQGIDPKRIRLGVAADHEPSPGTSDAAVESQNSRVEVFLLNEVAQTPEPAPPATNLESTDKRTNHHE